VHLRRAILEYMAHYHGERNHQGLGNALINGDEDDSLRGRPVVRRDRIGSVVCSVSVIGGWAHRGGPNSGIGRAPPEPTRYAGRDRSPCRVAEHNSVMPHAAFNGQTPDEVYFGSGDHVAARLAQRRVEARQARLTANRILNRTQCRTDGSRREASAVFDVVHLHPQRSQMSRSATGIRRRREIRTAR
jgi:hypothetical protein